MAAARSYWPARSSSKPWPIVCAGSERANRSATEQTATNDRIRPVTRGLSRDSAFPAEAGQGRFTGQCRVAGLPADSGRPERGRIEPPEILDYQAMLLGGETLKVVPRGVSD